MTNVLSSLIGKLANRPARKSIAVLTNEVCMQEGGDITYIFEPMDDASSVSDSTVYTIECQHNEVFSYTDFWCWGFDVSEEQDNDDEWSLKSGIVTANTTAPATSSNNSEIQDDISQISYQSVSRVSRSLFDHIYDDPTSFLPSIPSLPSIISVPTPVENQQESEKRKIKRAVKKEIRSLFKKPVKNEIRSLFEKPVLTLEARDSNSILDQSSSDSGEPTYSTGAHEDCEISV